MTAWIGETFTSDAGWDHLERLVDIGNRMAGTEGERKGAERTAEALEALGVENVTLEPFPIQGWWRGSSAIRADDAEADCIALPRSPSREATGDLVDVGHGLPEDFEAVDLEGSVVLARSDAPDWYDRYIHRREKYHAAVEGGAAAFVYRNHVEGCLPPTGNVGTASRPIGPIPAVGVSAEVGARLVRRWEGDRVTVAVDAEIDDATSQNVHGHLGPETDERVLVTSHVDAHDIAEGALDNGAGTAMVIEIARALADRAEELETAVHFVVYGAEEVGLVGSEHYAGEAELDTIKAIVNNDGVARGRTLELTTHGFDALGEAARTVADRFDHPIETVPEQGIHSDHWPFVKWGVPGYHARSVTDSDGRGWGHTRADTLDKVDTRDLREQAVLLTDLVVHLAAADVAIPHKDPEEIAAALEAEDLADGMKAAGDWPY